MLFEALGWIGNIALAVCGVPLAVQCLRRGTTSPTLDDLHLFLAFWIVGEFSTLAYVISLGNYPLLLNYAANVGALCIVIKYHWWPTNKGVDWLPPL